MNTSVYMYIQKIKHFEDRWTWVVVTAGSPGSRSRSGRGLYSRDTCSIVTHRCFRQDQKTTNPNEIGDGKMKISRSLSALGVK